jgi:hypothetical protein
MGEKLIVGDQSNHRVLIWNSIPKEDQTPADVVIGQADFNSNIAYSGGATDPRGIGSVVGLFVHEGRLFIAHKIISVWNKIPTENYIPSDAILGLVSPITLGALSEHTYWNSTQLEVHEGYLYIAGSSDYRIHGVPLRSVEFYTYPESNSMSGQLTALDCSQISEISVNEGIRPSSRDARWQKCSATPGALNFTLTDSKTGLHVLKVWMKDTQGRIKSDPLELPFYLNPHSSESDDNEE